jgi:RNA polymerase-associated protein RTF1
MLIACLSLAYQERKSVLDSKKDESEESDLDFGDDDDDSDDDYEETSFVAKPWQQKKQAKSTVSRLDQVRDSDEESEAEDDEAQREMGGPAVAKEAPPAELEDFLKVTIPRRRLARWCNEPFFEQAVKDSFVRLFIGEDDTGEKVYRLCQIVGFLKGEKTYKFPTASRHEKPVSQYIP